MELGDSGFRNLKNVAYLLERKLLIVIKDYNLPFLLCKKLQSVSQCLFELLLFKNLLRSGAVVSYRLSAAASVLGRILIEFIQ